MLIREWLCGIINISLALTLSLSPPTFDQKEDKQAAPQGKAVLWREPSDIASRDLYLGPGGEAMKPDVSNVTFIKDEAGGSYSKKYRVKDGAGRVWVAKLSSESQSETVANRLLWAVGYFTEISYLVPRVTIEGKGSFENIRFEARPENIKREGEWSWDRNPFIDTPEFRGLKVLMLMFNNWDIKDENNKILVARNEQSGEGELLYIISDLGATFGKTGSFFSRTRNKPEDYAKAKFIEGVKGNYVKFNYDGKRADIFQRVTVEDVKWAADLMSRLSDQQIAEAFRAGNYSDQQIQLLTAAFKERIREMKSL
ncbi:MAG TPA: hypothetical protein VE262_16550 [Blastocatellia bacterium]|nr:hypothetical protein [Blastocatellia bacterium]